jgi:hypothetical protein
MSEKQYVIVKPQQVRSYVAQGYQLSEVTAKERLGPLWNELPPNERGLVVLEVDNDIHARLNDSHPKKYRMYMGGCVYMFDTVEVASVRVLEETSGEGAYIAREDIDSAPEECGKHDLFETAGECIADKREYLQQKIAQYRNAANKLETFLIHTAGLT